ncbi:GNAT family N-acetyltransferase [Amycolatopsis aidingensis]|uniref:GNAT family N-acetyltransferase n=1 Tax=Amycolatopsis aidingensis TaxID=2842453 RepID=UPI001C0BC660|nr:GNAT family N-acetyltransferase [Amycolatopsis aidingensis]
MSSSPDVRLATEADVPRAVATLGRAFDELAFTRHIIAADRHAERLHEFQELLVRLGLRHGRVWVGAEGAAVAVWTTPETANAEAAFADLGPRFAAIAGDRAPAQANAEAVMEPHRPKEPAWFLASTGVEPGQQGRGLGTAVLRPGLEEADRVGVPAFLETSVQRNLGFYRRLGFEVTAEYPLPDDGPLTWSMLRRPQR